MKRFLALAVMLLGAILAPAQQVLKGTVTDVLQLPAHSAWTYDFSILGNAGGTDQSYFKYSDPRAQGAFELQYTGSLFCKTGCSYSGNFVQWYSPTALPNGCIVFMAELSGTFSNGFHYHTDVPGYYAQTYCQQGGADRYAAGDFSVFVAQ